MTAIYNNFKTLLFSGDIDLDGDVIRVALVNNSISYTPDIDAEAYVADVLDGVTASEFSDASYSRKGVSLSITQDDVEDEAVADGGDLTWDTLDGETIQGVLLYKQVGGDDTTPADDPLIAYITSSDFPLPANGGDVTVQWNTEGILNLG